MKLLVLFSYKAIKKVLNGQCLIKRQMAKDIKSAANPPHLAAYRKGIQLKMAYQSADVVQARSKQRSSRNKLYVANFSR